jgi:hypothetical protein
MIRICVPAREVYLRLAGETSTGASQADPGTVIEIQYPEEKV